jgi:glycosyltransferase involved in cell wall biosynthesis
MVQRGHDVQLITSDQHSPAAKGWRETSEAGIRVHWARVPYRNDMGFGSRIRSFLIFAAKATVRALSLKGDVIIATSTPLTIAIPALIASAWNRIPFVFEVRDNWPDVPIAIGALRNPLAIRLARALERGTYHRASHIIALAPGLRDDIIAKGVPPEKVTVIPNGCDLDVFEELSAGISPREEFDWLGSRKMVLFAGTLGLLNGVEYLVRVAAEVSRLDPEIRFVIIGDGRDYKAVRDLASEMGILDRNLFTFPAMPKIQLARWVRAADLITALFTGPRIVWKDGVQNKFFDALAAGKPIACNFDGWQTRVADEAGIGLMLDPLDYSAAASQLTAALGNQPWLQSVPARAKVLSRGRFNRDRLAHDLERVLMAVVESKR